MRRDPRSVSPANLRHSDGEILLVHVIRPINGVSDSEMGDFYDRLRGDAAARMRDRAPGSSVSGTSTFPCSSPWADPAREIDRIARERGADLIVVSHGAPAPLGKRLVSKLHTWRHAPS